MLGRAAAPGGVIVLRAIGVAIERAAACRLAVIAEAVGAIAGTADRAVVVELPPGIGLAVGRRIGARTARISAAAITLVAVRARLGAIGTGAVVGIVAAASRVTATTRVAAAHPGARHSVRRSGGGARPPRRRTRSGPRRRRARKIRDPGDRHSRRDSPVRRADRCFHSPCRAPFVSAMQPGGGTVGD